MTITFHWTYRWRNTYRRKDGTLYWGGDDYGSLRTARKYQGPDAVGVELFVLNFCDRDTHVFHILNTP